MCFRHVLDTDRCKGRKGNNVPFVPDLFEIMKFPIQIKKIIN